MKHETTTHLKTGQHVVHTTLVLDVGCGLRWDVALQGLDPFIVLRWQKVGPCGRHLPDLQQHKTKAPKVAAGASHKIK